MSDATEDDIREREAGDPAAAEDGTTFADLGLRPELLAALTVLGSS